MSTNKSKQSTDIYSQKAHLAVITCDHAQTERRLQRWPGYVIKGNASKPGLLNGIFSLFFVINF